MANGLHTDACARLKFKVGSADVQNDAFANICFDAVGLLRFVGMPGYGMEFHDYKRFGKQAIARRYQDDPEPGTKIVANVVVLEEYKNPDSSLFIVDKPTLEAQKLRSVRVDQKTIEVAAVGQLPLTWPKVQSGKTEGLLSMYILVARNGEVREAYPLNADNPGLQDAARDQLVKWKLKPMTADGVPVEAEAALSFRFETSLISGTAPAPVSPSSSTLHVSPGLVAGFLIENPPPVYPEAAKQNHVQGKVVLDLIINQEERTQNIQVLTSPDPSLTDAAIAAVSRWRYRPYQLNGTPVAIQSTVEVNFQLH